MEPPKKNLFMNKKFFSQKYGEKNGCIKKGVVSAGLGCRQNVKEK